jgi:Protein of unknown function (DUF2927)
LTRFLAALLALALPAAAQTDDTRFLDEFVTIALGREFGGPSEGQLVKWTQPVRVAVIGQRANYYLPVVQQHLADLRETTGHMISISDDPKAADVWVILVNKLDRGEIDKHRSIYRPFFRNDQSYNTQVSDIHEGKFRALCLTTVKVKGREGIQSGIIFIPLERGAPTVWQCVVEELAQLMGLPNDSDNVLDSIFNDRSPHISMTEKDRRMLRLLYEPRLKSGMKEPEVRRVAGEILREWRNKR